MASPLTPGMNQPKHDLVHTPPWLVATILQHYTPSGHLLDPAAGKNRVFYNELQRYSSRVDYCEILDGTDFFDWTSPVDWIITNPPWSKMRRFLLHSMTLASDVVFLATITHFVTRARLRDISNSKFSIKTIALVDQPSAPWPSSGFQLAAVHLTRGHNSSIQLVDLQSPITAPTHFTLEDLGLG